MERERRYRNGIPEYYDDYYYDDYYDEYYYDSYNYAPKTLGIPRPHGVGLSRYNTNNKKGRH